MINKDLLVFVIFILIGFTVGFSIREAIVLKTLASVGIFTSFQLLWLFYRYKKL